MKKLRFYNFSIGFNLSTVTNRAVSQPIIPPFLRSDSCSTHFKVVSKSTQGITSAVNTQQTIYKPKNLAYYNAKQIQTTLYRCHAQFIECQQRTIMAVFHFSLVLGFRNGIYEYAAAFHSCQTRWPSEILRNQWLHNRAWKEDVPSE